MLIAAAPTPAAFAADRAICLLAVEENAGRLGIIGPDGVVRRRLSLGERPHEVAVSANHRIAYVPMFGITDYDSALGTPGTTIAEIDLRKGKQVASFALPAGTGAPHGARLRPGHPNELFVNVEAGGPAMLVFDVKTRRLLRQFPLREGTHHFVFAADGATLFAFAGAAGVTRHDVATGRETAQRDLGSPVRGLFVSRTGSVLASARGEIVELAAADLAIVRRRTAPRPGQYVYLAELDDGTIIAPSLADDGVAVFPGDGGAARFVATGKTPIQVQPGPDGRLYVGNVQDDHVSILDRSGAVVGAIGGLVSPNGLGFGVCPY